MEMNAHPLLLARHVSAALIAGTVLGCGAVALLSSDPSAARDRDARFDRFVSETHMALIETAPLLDRVRFKRELRGRAGASWSEERRLEVRRATILRALERLEDDFSPARFDGDRALVARTMQFDLRRALGLPEENARAALELGEDVSGGRASAPAAPTPWSGPLVEAASVLAREHPCTSATDLGAWLDTLSEMFEGDTDLTEPLDARILEDAYGARAAIVVDALASDLERIAVSAGTGSVSDPLLGPFLDATRSIPGPEAARRAARQPRRLQREIDAVYDDAVLRAGAARGALPAADSRRAVSPLDGRARSRWLRRLRDAAGDSAEIDGLTAVARAQIERLTLELGEVLGAPADLARVRAAFDAVRRRERELPGPERFRTPVVLWNSIEPKIEQLVAGPLPELVVEVDEARTFERPHGRWSPYVRGNLVPASDPRARPFLFLTSRSRDPSVPRWLVEAEALRYGLPGHALADAFRRAATTVPEFVRAREREAFENGWGLYAAGRVLAEELIEFDDDGFGILAQELAAFVALAIDLGMHDRGWSYAQALDTAVEWTPLPEIAVRETVLRTIAEPGRSALPAIGLLRIRALRSAIEDRLGPAFQAADFHRALLQGGPLPMGELDGRIERWLVKMRAEGAE